MSDERTPRDELGHALERLAAADRSACVAEERLAAFYAGQLVEADADAIRDHLAVCESCIETARDARAFLAAMRDAEPPRRRVAPLLGALAAAAVLVIGLVSLRRANRIDLPTPRATASAPSASAPANAWADLVVEKAPYAAPADDVVWRDEEESSADEFASAMEPYARGDLEEAQKRLAGHVARHPRDARARFYRGVSLLVLGRPAEARPLLQSAAGEAALRDDARWYLALSCLRLGDHACALRELDALQGSPGRRDAADVLLRRLRALPP